MSFIAKAKKHLMENKMTYTGHLIFATKHGLACLKAGVYLVVHGFLPCFFSRAGSNLVEKLNKVFVDWKERKSSAGTPERPMGEGESGLM